MNQILNREPSAEMCRSLRVLRLSDVIQKTGLSKSTIYARIRSHEFPASIPLGARAVGFVEVEVDDYLRGLIKRVRSH